jgi:RNA polymerase sigma-B factor
MIIRTDTQQRAAHDAVVSLIEAYRDRGDRRAIERVLALNTKILTHLARRYAGSSDEPFEDILQVGYVGLMKAVNKYKLDSEARFSSYAYAMIEGEIRHHLRDTELVKKPRWARSLYSRVSEANARLSAELGRPPHLEETAREVNVTPQGIMELMKVFASSNAVSIDGAGDDETADLSAIRNLQHDSFSLPIEDRIQLERALKSLSEIQRKVIYLFFYKDLCQTEIGKKLGLSQRKTSRTVASALKALKGSKGFEDSEDAISWGLE